MPRGREELWQPSARARKNSALTRFIQFVEKEHALSITQYSELHHWSIHSPEQFWPAVWRFTGVKASSEWIQVLKDEHKMPGAQWFVGAKLNFAENLLRFRDLNLALVFCREDGRRETMTYKALYKHVAECASAFQKIGVQVGDRIVGFLPNCPSAIIVMLAATSMGAIWSSCSPDFGVQGLLDRFGQIEPTLLFTADGYEYNGKSFDSLAIIRAALPHLTSLRKIVVIPYLKKNPPLDIPGSVFYQDFVEHDAKTIAFKQLPFDHPVYILYSSGTTGTPKCIVHGGGGTLLQHLKEHVLHLDLKREDVFFYYTTCGWMMWNWLVSGLASGATLVLYDGSPFFPTPARLLDLIDAEKVSLFGVSAKYIASLEKERLVPRKTHRLTSVRSILSTGSPLLPENYDYIYQSFKKDVQLSSISGGTDIVSCFALGNPLLPVHRGELQCLGLGMNVEVWNEQGQSVCGERGELVCISPFPSMPVGFWNDPKGRRYRDAYFKVFPNVWRHGDYALLTERGSLVIFGRSDAVLNPGGVRIGTAEIYRPMEKIDEIVESLVVGQKWQDDERIILFVKLRPDLSWSPELEARIQKTIREDTTPRHVPSKIIPIADIPKTLNGKIAELAVCNILHGRKVTNQNALANPESLKLYQNLPELKT
ncbi:MAG: acetoacetate--CoA ligase [Gammaproteobacteria bacterium]|nr:acetoacetate--CoA ligase [Gammaproteobacteria bacterium]